MGVTDGIANVAHGITNQVADVLVVENARPPRALGRSTADFSLLTVMALDLTAAAAQHFVMKHKNTPAGDAFVAALTVSRVEDGKGGRSHDVVVALTERAAYLLKCDSHRHMHTEWSFLYGEISHCVLHKESHTVEAVVYKSSSSRTGYKITCKDDEISETLYNVLWGVRHRMGNPSSMLPPVVVRSEKFDEDVSGAAFDSLDSTQVDRELAAELEGAGRSRKPSIGVGRQNSIIIDPTVGLDGYKFGTANGMKFPMMSCSDKELLKIEADRLKMVPSGARMLRVSVEDEDEVKAEGDGEGERSASMWSDATDSVGREDQRRLDEALWQMVSDWSSAHSGMSSCRCCLLAIINRSSAPVQILRTEVTEGRNVHIYGVGGGAGYDAESRSIMPNGVAVVFAYGFRPSIVDKAHVKVCVFTSAFTATVATRKDRTNCEAVGGCCAGYLEKSLTEWWGKYVLVVAN
jgi:hypothetical protein